MDSGLLIPLGFQTRELMPIKMIECPRDAMQGWKTFIPTEYKAKYINQLLKIGFDTLDFGSFVSPKAIPQMRDTAEVLKKLELSQSGTKLLAIVANQRGVEEASQFEEIAYLGYPFSISESFQLRNTHKTIAESFASLDAMQNAALKHDKQMVVYLSMGFGNPYGEPWSIAILAEWAERLIKKGIRIIALSDTIGVSQREGITAIYKALVPQYPQVEFGAHLHSRPETWREKIDAAYQAGCRRFDTTIKGFGGCPMAKDVLVGNMPTEKVVQYMGEKKIASKLDKREFKRAYALSKRIFTTDFDSPAEEMRQEY